MYWADEIERSIADLYSAHGAILAGDGDGKIAAALRKAKADGMREAGALIQAKSDSYLKVGTFIRADILADYATEIGVRANQIEKGE